MYNIFRNSYKLTLTFLLNSPNIFYLKKNCFHMIVIYIQFITYRLHPHNLIMIAN